MRTWRGWFAAAAGLLVAAVGLADSGRPVEKETFYSTEGSVSVEVDPRWIEVYRKRDPRLTLRRGQTTIWERGPEDFEDFRYPLDVKVSDDGRWLVFGGSSVHNISFDPDYREGLRFYDAQGKLVRFVSRRDLPVGDCGISSAVWYDSARTRLEGAELEFYTPRRDEPLVFDVTTGELIQGRLVPGQGDDSHHEEWLRSWTSAPAAPSSQAPPVD